MKIYQVEYIGMDDNFYNEFFTVKSKAQQRFSQLNKKRDKIHDDYVEDNDATCKQVFSIYEFECEISKTGIINLLNNRFHQP